MEVLASFVDILCSYNEIFWLYQWVNLILRKRAIELINRGKWLEIVLKITYVIIVFLFNRVELTSVNTMMVIMIFNFVAVLCFWKCNIAQAFAIVGGYFFLLFLKGNVEIAITGILGGSLWISITTSERGVYRIIYIIISASLLWLLHQKLIKWVSRKHVHRQSIGYFAYVSVIGFLGSAFIGSMMLKSFNLRINIIWNMFLVMILFIFYGVYFLLKVRDEKIKLQLMTVQNELLEKNYKQVNEFYTANAKLYHDMRHHFKIIYSMLQQGKSENAMEYIQSLQETNDYMKMKVWSGVNVLDAVLHESNLRANDKGIRFVIETPLLPCNIGITNKDIASLFSNLLENALDAATNEVTLNIKKVNRTIFITVKNDYSVRPIRKGGRFVSYKSEDALHGWGTQIIEQIVEKYEGTIENEISEKYFVTRIMLNEK